LSFVCFIFMLLERREENEKAKVKQKG